MSNLPNIDSSGEICLGNFIASEYIPWINDELSTQADKIIHHFWCSEFEDYYGDEHDDGVYKNKSLKSLHNWEEASKKNPGFILKLKGWKSISTLKSMLKYGFEGAVDENRDVFDDTSEKIWGKVSSWGSGMAEHSLPKDVLKVVDYYLKSIWLRMKDLKSLTKSDIECLKSLLVRD
jgi:hypothetical protein